MNKNNLWEEKNLTEQSKKSENNGGLDECVIIKNIKDLKEKEPLKDTIFQKNCPKCNSIQTYKRIYELNRAIKRNAICESCTHKLPSPLKQDLTGNIYGRLTVISFKEKRGIHQYWNCKCDCGNITSIKHSHLTRQTIRSCGCSHFYIKSKHAAWTGIGEMSGAYLSSIKQSARIRNLKYDLTKEQIWGIFLKQNGKCALSGIDLKFQSRGNIRDGTASLDRIDSSKNYSIDNVQWVHKIVNIMKQDSNESDFINWCKLIANKSKNEQAKKHRAGKTRAKSG